MMKKTTTKRTGTAGAGKTALALAFLLAAAGTVSAEGEEGAWSLEGWTRANFGWDFEGEKQLPKPDGDWDATGAGTTLSWTKGPWKVAGTAEVTSENFGTTYGASGNVTATYSAGDWTVSGKIAQAFNDNGQYEWYDTNDTVDSDGDGDPKNDKDSTRSIGASGRTAQFSVENWKQDANGWGIKGVAVFDAYTSYDSPLLTYKAGSDDNKAAFFINFWDKQILLEGGYGDYSDAAWGTPGPYEINLESADDEDSALRVQFKPGFLSGLNLGFAYMPAPGHNAVNAGLADSTFVSVFDSPSPATTGFGALKPVDVLRAVTFGVKYAPADGPLVAAAGFNLKKDAEKGYLGVSYKILTNLTLYVDTQAYDASGFGTLDLGEKIVFVDNPDDTRLEIGLTLKENRMVRTSGDTSAKDFELYLNPWVRYDFIPKTARGQLGFELTKGLGETNKDHTAWLLTTQFGWSVKESLALDPDDIGTGFVVKYKFGVAEDVYAIDKGVTAGKATTNQLYFGFKASL